MREKRKLTYLALSSTWNRSRPRMALISRETFTMIQDFNVQGIRLIVVGAGHAGCEAAAAAANMGSKVLPGHHESDHNCQNVMQPGMGGVAKGQIVRRLMPLEVFLELSLTSP